MSAARRATAAAALLLLATPAAPAAAESPAAPCTDFDAFANGAWRAENPIPAGAQRWSRRLAARAANRRQLTALLQELTAAPGLSAGSVEQQLGDHFAACMDEAAIDGAGVAPLAPLIAATSGARDRKDVERAIRRLHELAVPAPFVLSGASDYRDPEGVIANIAAGGLGLPDRDDYLKAEAPFVEKRARYQAHVAAVLTLGGMAAEPARKAAADVVALETRLAEASLPPATAADPAATAHKTTFARLKAARFDWQGYFAEAGLPQADVNVAEPAFLERLDAELDTTPVEVWKSYLTWHLLASASPWLSKPFAAEFFSFKNGSPSGATALPPRAERCLESTETLLGEPLGRKYAERYFPAASKARVQEMARGLIAALKDEVAGLKWLSPAARQEALAKVARYDVKVGYPDTWTDFSALPIRRDAFWANVAAARRFGVELDRRRVGTRTSRQQWLLPPSSPDAYIDVQLNLMALPAGFLQPPAFDPAATDAANYGAIGVAMAHDVTHALDLLGADFDAAGQPRNWWTEPDRQAFEKLGQCVVEQYDGYSIEPGVHLEGKRVRGEAIGDMAGLRVAYLALQRSMRQKAVPAKDGFSPEQQFFLALARHRGAAESVELQRQLLKTDTHAVAKYRVIGPLSNAPEFQKAFACAPAAPMVRPADARCSVW